MMKNIFDDLSGTFSQKMFQFIRKCFFISLNLSVDILFKPVNLLIRPINNISDKFPAPLQRTWYKLHSHYLRFYGFPIGKPLTVDSDKVIIFLPQMGWNNMRQRPHHLPRAFNKAGWTVIFLTQDIDGDKVIGYKEISPGFYICSRVRLLRKIKNPWIYMNYTVNMFYLRYFKEFRFIYDYVDRLEIHTYYTKKMIKEHYRSLKIARVVTATASVLYNEIITIRPDAILVPNAVFPEDFLLTEDTPVPEDMTEIICQGKPVVGYYGIFSKWKIDYDLILFIAKELPEVNIVLMGPDYDQSLYKYPWQDYANIHVLGKKNYWELPAYANRFDVALLPLLVNDVTNTISPVKLFEYFAMKLPVVSADIEESRKYESVLIAKSHEDFIIQIRKALRLKTDPAHRALVEKDLEQNTWDARCKKIRDRISEIE